MLWLCLEHVKHVTDLIASDNRPPCADKICQEDLEQIANSRLSLHRVRYLKKSLVCLALIDWEKLRDKEEAINCPFFGLVFVARNNGEKVVIKKLFSEEDQEKHLFIKEAKILHGIKNEHIVKFTAVCISNDKKLLFNPFLGERCNFSQICGF